MKIHQKLKVVSVTGHLITLATPFVTDEHTEVKVVNIKTGKLASDAEAKAFHADRALMMGDKKKKNLHLKFRRETIRTIPLVSVSIEPEFGQEMKIKTGDTVTLTIN